jgi:hypothetical protein
MLDDVTENDVRWRYTKVMQGDFTKSDVWLFLEKHFDHARVVAVVVAKPLGRTPLDQGRDTLDLRLLRPEDAVRVLPD